MLKLKFFKSIRQMSDRFFSILADWKNLTKYIPPFLFFTFICWMIFMADLNRENLIMTIGHKVPSGDKIGHFMLFGILAYFLNTALKFRQFKFKKQRFYLGSIIVLLFAICEEFSQLAFENRTFDWVDMVFDFWGVAALSSEKVRGKVKLYLHQFQVRQKRGFSFSILRKK
ncbi:MAG: VanZ family protein [Cyclobacteriaceae bacterium]